MFERVVMFGKLMCSTFVALLLLVGQARAQNLVGDSCVTNYDPSVDYFPDKLDQEYSAGFRVSYSNSYKVITCGAVGTIIAYQCGTPPPNHTALGADVAVAIPLR